MDAALQETREKAHNGSLPYLSFSRIDKYLLCPEQYRLYYIENLRARLTPASLVFGQTVHRALAHLFTTGEDPVTFFENAWMETKALNLAFKEREPWERLASTGRALLNRFVEQDLRRLGTVVASEKSFELGITSLDLPFVGVIDLVADLDLKRTVVDFKTSSSSYQDHEVVLSDQLSGYQLAVPDAEQAALCVFVKTKEPRIDWFISKRTGDQLNDFLRKASYVASEITAGHFFKRPGRWCSWCDYLPICIGDRQKAEETLVLAD